MAGEKTANATDIAKAMVVKFPKVAGVSAMKDIVHGVLSTIVETASTSKKGVSIQGIGVFKFKETQERYGRNPRTGEPVFIPASRKLVFKKSKQL